MDSVPTASVSVQAMHLYCLGSCSRCGALSGRIPFGLQQGQRLGRQLVCRKRFASSTKYPEAFRLSVNLDVSAGANRPVALRLVRPKRIGFACSADGSSSRVARRPSVVQGSIPWSN